MGREGDHQHAGEGKWEKTKRGGTHQTCRGRNGNEKTREGRVRRNTGFSRKARVKDQNDKEEGGGLNRASVMYICLYV